MITAEDIRVLPSPCYLVDESELMKNLSLLARLREETACKVLLALKGFAMWKLFERMRDWLDGVNAASLHEARLGLQEFKKEVHLCAVAYSAADFGRLFELLAADPPLFPFTVVFNSLSQWQKFSGVCREGGIECGLRVNPELPVVKTPLYDPCRPGSRLGVTADELDRFPPGGLAGLSGLHFHALCEQNAEDLEAVLAAFEKKFGKYLPGLKWVNFGGGHHITRIHRLHPELGILEDYHCDLLVRMLREFRKRWDIQVYLEPGEAVVLGAGVLVATVLDIIMRDLPIAVLDTSAAAHMPDVIEMPYQPPVGGAVPLKAAEPAEGRPYRLAGNTCLAGDVIGEYLFPKPLAVGDRVVFLDQAHYTMVKNTAFNGVALPALAVKHQDGTIEVIREFGYDDYKMRLS